MVDSEKIYYIDISASATKKMKDNELAGKVFDMCHSIVSSTAKNPEGVISIYPIENGLFLIVTSYCTYYVISGAEHNLLQTAIENGEPEVVLNNISIKLN